jgi:hypothetical protein
MSRCDEGSGVPALQFKSIRKIEGRRVLRRGTLDFEAPTTANVIGSGPASTPKTRRFLPLQQHDLKLCSLGCYRSSEFWICCRVYTLPSRRTTCICDGRFCRREINFGKRRRSLRHARCQLCGIFAGEARSLPRCVHGPSAPACELGIFSLSVAEMPQWDAFRKSLDEVDNPAGALS